MASLCTCGTGHLPRLVVTGDTRLEDEGLLVTGARKVPVAVGGGVPVASEACLVVTEVGGASPIGGNPSGPTRERSIVPGRHLPVAK